MAEVVDCLSVAAGRRCRADESPLLLVAIPVLEPKPMQVAMDACTYLR
jgi:hypothetical protein